MEFIPAFIDGVFTIEVNRFEDERGVFARTFCKNEFRQIGFDKEFVQFNHSHNKTKGTVRGMHFQLFPYGETKLIRCIQGSVYDVAVDLRKDSPTFLKYFGVELSASNMKSILIPEGFAHGFQALQDNTSLIYHHTQYYSAGADSGMLYNDPGIGITWPLPAVNVSKKDLSFKEIDHTFKGITI